MGDAAKEMAELGGGVRTAKSAMMQMYNPDLFNMYQQAMKSKNPALLMADEFRKRAPQINAAVDNLVGGITAGGPDIADALGQTTDLYDALERITALKDLNPAEYKKKVQELMDQTKGRIVQGTKQEQYERRIQNAYQELIYTIGDAAVPAITMFTKALNTMGFGLAKFFKGITGIDYTGLFETFENYNETVKALNEEEINQKQLKQQSAKIQKEIDETTRQRDERIKKGDDLNDWSSSAAALQIDINNQKSKLKDIQNQIETSKGRQQTARAAQTSFTEGTPVSQGTKENGLEGVRLKQGPDGALAAGATVTPELAAFAKKLAETIPEYTYISSLNDEYHKGTNSKHAQGKALDFTLANRPNAEEANAIIKRIQAIDPSVKVLDEYNGGSERKKGGHFHVELAKNGGLFNGPSSGYPVMLHGKESVLPTKALDNLVSKLPLPGTLFGEGNNSSMSDTQDLLNAMKGVQSMLDTLHNTFRRSLGVQEDILTHTKMLA
jgi:L-rhamnose mutarotase